jgi:hypothetical protein
LRRSLAGPAAAAEPYRWASFDSGFIVRRKWKMYKKTKKVIGASLLGVGVLMAFIGGVWSFQQGLWDFTQGGPSVGISKVFFLVLFLPTVLLLSVGGFILCRPEWVVKSQIAQYGFGVISFLSVLAALLFVGSNVMWNIKYYGGVDVGWVLFMNLLFALPLLVCRYVRVRAARQSHW